MAYPTALTAPLPLGGLLTGERALAALKLLRAHGTEAVAGLDEATVPLVARAAAEPGIVEYCPNDRSRFGDVAAAERWAAKGRGFVAVLDPAGADRLLAYGWSGAEPNEHVPGADVTTAYRVTEAGQRFARSARRAGADGFRLGLLLGELVIGTAVALGGAAEDEISLETWASNAAARRVYADLGFVQPPGADEVPAVRPTLEPVGTRVGDAVVRIDPDEPTRRLVDDRRCFYVLRRASG